MFVNISKAHLIFRGPTKLSRDLLMIISVLMTCGRRHRTLVIIIIIIIIIFVNMFAKHSLGLDQLERYYGVQKSEYKKRYQYIEQELDDIGESQLISGEYLAIVYVETIIIAVDIV